MLNRREALAKLGAAIGIGVIAPVAAAAAIQDECVKPIAGVGVLRYPVGETVIDEQVRENREIAKDLSDQMQSGCILVLPACRDEEGSYLWDFRIEGGDPKQVRIERSTK